MKTFIRLPQGIDLHPIGYRRPPKIAEAITKAGQTARLIDQPHTTWVSSTRSRPSARTASWMGFAELRWRGSSIRRTAFSSMPRRAASTRVVPVSRSATASAAFTAVSAGTETRYSPGQIDPAVGADDPQCVRHELDHLAAPAVEFQPRQLLRLHAEPLHHLRVHDHGDTPAGLPSVGQPFSDHCVEPVQTRFPVFDASPAIKSPARGWRSPRTSVPVPAYLSCDARQKVAVQFKRPANPNSKRAGFY